jgi:hypothetical protein
VTPQLKTSEKAATIGTGWLWIPWFVALAFALLSALLYFTNLRLKNDLLAIQTSARTQEADLRQSRALIGMLNSSATVLGSLHAESEGTKPSGQAVYDPQIGNVILLVSNLAPAPAEKIYQFWLFPEQGSAISAGTFRVDARGSAAVIQKSLPSGVQVKTFGISLEQRGGAETPTSSMVISGIARK